MPGCDGSRNPPALCAASPNGPTQMTANAAGTRENSVKKTVPKHPVDFTRFLRHSPEKNPPRQSQFDPNADHITKPSPCCAASLQARTNMSHLSNKCIRAVHIRTLIFSDRQLHESETVVSFKTRLISQRFEDSIALDKLRRCLQQIEADDFAGVGNINRLKVSLGVFGVAPELVGAQVNQ